MHKHSMHYFMVVLTRLVCSPASAHPSSPPPLPCCRSLKGTPNEGFICFPVYLQKLIVVFIKFPLQWLKLLLVYIVSSFIGVQLFPFIWYISSYSKWKTLLLYLSSEVPDLPPHFNSDQLICTLFFELLKPSTLYLMIPFFIPWSNLASFLSYFIGIIL